MCVSMCGEHGCMTVSGATCVCAGGGKKRHSWVCVSGHSFAV